MSDLFSFMPKTGTVHVMMPNMAAACGLDPLAAWDAGDEFTFNLRATSTVVTCQWCRCLGPRTRADLARLMQGQQAAIIN